MVLPETDGTHIWQQTHGLPSVRVSQASAFVPRRTEATPFVARTPMGDEMAEETVREHRSTMFGRRIPQLTTVELRQLKAVHVDVPTVPIFHSVPREGYCD